MKKITGLDVYRFVSILALVAVGILFIFYSINDIDEHSFPQLLVIILMNVIVSFLVLKKKK